MKIEPLPTDVRSYLRSGVAITSVTQCLEELVLNSLDAGATCVAVRVDLNCYKVQVVDNGSGVPQDQLDILGNRFCTSKCHGMSDLENLCHFGYRGEALASIRDSCGILEITARSKLGSKTYCKIFQSGKSLKVSESTIARPSVGTTITVHNLFANFPVRQKSLNKNHEIERMKEMLEGIALIRSGISFTFRNDSNGQVILSTRKCSSINSSFGQLFGTAKADMLAEVQGSKEIFKVQGYIGREGNPRKNLQYIYVNGRIVKKSKIHKLLNKLLLNLPALKPKLRMPSDGSQIQYNKYSVFMSPPKFSEAYPVYILEVKCPVSEYDITFEPAKTMVEFKDWDILLTCVEELTQSFLTKENAAIKADVIACNGNEPAKESEEAQNVPVISTDTMKDALASKTVKRKAEQKNNTSLVVKSSESGESLKVKGVHNTDQNAEEDELFKTPLNKKLKVNKAAIGLGNRDLGIETDTDDGDKEDDEGVTDFNNTSISIESTFSQEVTSSTSDINTSTSDDSCVKDTEKATPVANENVNTDTTNKFKQELDKSKQTCDSTGITSNQKSGVSPQCSLSRYRQSIGKFSGRQAKNISIDESLKKLNKILPSTSKPTSKTLFSSLQRFRRRIETTSETFEERCIPEEHDVVPVRGTVVDIDSESQEPATGLYESTIVEYNSVKTSWHAKPESTATSRESESKFLTPCDIKLLAPIDDRLKTNESPRIKSVENENKQVESLTIISSSSQENVGGFMFSPRFDVSIEEVRNNSNQMTDVSESCSVENKHIGNHNFYTSEEEKTSFQDNVDELHNSNFHCDIDYLDCDKQKTKYKSKRHAPETESAYADENQIKYTARSLTPAELESDLNTMPYDCDTENGMCNKNNCDNLFINPKKSKLSECDKTKECYIGACDISTDVSEVMDIGLNLREKCETQDGSEAVKDDCVIFATDVNIPVTRLHEIQNELNFTNTDRFLDSTQAFSPRLSSGLNKSEKPAGMEVEINPTGTPESLGFTPKLQIESLVNTPNSTGFSPYKYIENSDNANKTFGETGTGKLRNEIDSVGMSYQGTEQDHIGHKNNVSDNQVEYNDTKTDLHVVIAVPSISNKLIQEDTSLCGTTNDSITLTELLNTPTQVTDIERKTSDAESEEVETNTQEAVLERKGFSFADLFSQTPCSLETDVSKNDIIQNIGEGLQIIKNDAGCVNCNIGMSEGESEIGKCSEKGDNFNKNANEGKEKSGSTMDDKAADVNDYMLWADSPWDTPETSSNVIDDIKKEQTVVGETHEQLVCGSGSQADGRKGNGSFKTTSGNDIVKKNGDPEKQDINTFDNLDVWYQRLDEGASVSVDILQSKKPSDVVKRLHACRFSKDSLKSVKVLGQLDKKFIACLISTEEQGTDTDPTMLVLIDQHAAHERIRLEILTEDAFQDGIKGGQLAPYVVDPPYTMTFAEHEVRTVLSFQEKYLKLGINLKEHTPTTVLISSVPTSLIDKEKNNKIYWSTVQVLIREHISMFMSTQISHGVLPQTLHKVLCSLACHGAIKFGDRLSTDECVGLIKDLSRCDLPFQCAHGRPSVMPLFHMDKLQLLSHSTNQSKPNLWKLRQAVKLKKI